MGESDPGSLTKAQRDIMEVVWAAGEVTVTEVRDALAKKRDVGRTFIYSAARSKTVSLGAKVSQMVDRLFAGSPENLVNALIEYRGLSSDESERIREMIEQAEAKQASPKTRGDKR